MEESVLPTIIMHRVEFRVSRKKIIANEAKKVMNFGIAPNPVHTK